MVHQETAFAKLNLTLDILRKRPDGYHDLRMVMQSIDLTDTVTVEERDQPGFLLRSNLGFLPCDDSNIAAKAARRFFEALGQGVPGLSMSLEKSIPVCAGMAGGSSDGAAVLRILRRRYAPQMSREELETIGALVGSDVPYCVRCGTALAEGRGEILQDLPPLPECWFVICKPPFSISTPELFSQVKVKKLRCHPDSDGMIRALEQGDLEGVAHRIYNVFEDVLPRKYARVFEIRHQMLELGAMASAMTGSGPTVFGMFRDKDSARIATEVLRRQYVTVHLCKNTGRVV